MSYGADLGLAIPTGSFIPVLRVTAPLIFLRGIMATVWELIEHLVTEHDPNEVIASAVFCRSDVDQRASEMGEMLSSTEADKVLINMDQKFDCSGAGMNWDYMDTHIRIVVRERPGGRHLKTGP